MEFAAFRPRSAVLLMLIAGGACWIAFSFAAGAAAVFVAMYCVCKLGRLRTPRQSFYAGLAAGTAMYVAHLWFFASIFAWQAIAFWLLAGFPVGVFVLLLNLAHRRLGSKWVLGMTPVLWTGVEYFRSELYYFRFAWLLPGQAAAFLPGVRLAWIGVYGLGFLYAAAVAMAASSRKGIRFGGILATIVLASLMYIPPAPTTPAGAGLNVAGIQLELPDDAQVIQSLDRLAVAHPEAQILVLSEYTFRGPVPQAVRDVVRRHRRYLVAGGIKPLDSDDFYDMAFVVGPDGQDVFEQGKSVPVQCMNDGLPAPQRRVWESPWGRIGISVCYDLSYARVMDDFVRQGAQGLIIPTMDAEKWGAHERRMLHGRIAPIRSAEYGIPTFGVWSSGVSQLTDRFGNVIATAGYPGQGEMIAGPFNLQQPARVPPDRILAMLATIATWAFIGYLLVRRIREKITRRFRSERG